MLAAELFALVVFLCDEFLVSTPANEARDQPATRFFSMMSRLPLEIQLMTCARVYNLDGDDVRRADTEAAFFSVGGQLALESRPPEASPQKQPKEGLLASFLNLKTRLFF